jgi:hypothetical protein
MESPLKISFQGGDTSEALTGLINEHVEALEKVYGRMTACHVMVQIPDKLNGPFAVHIDHTPTADDRFFDPQFAVNDAFRRAKRALKDRSSRLRGDVKSLHERIDRTLDRPEG